MHGYRLGDSRTTRATVVRSTDVTRILHRAFGQWPAQCAHYRCRWQQASASILMLFMPWWVTKPYVLPWFIGKVLRSFIRELASIFNTEPGTFRRAAQTTKALTGGVQELLVPIIGMFVLGLLLPWKLWKGLYMLSAIRRVPKLLRESESNVALAGHLTMLCILPAVVWYGIVPWFARRVAEMSVVLLRSLPKLCLEGCVTFAVMVAAETNAVL